MADSLSTPERAGWLSYVPPGKNGKFPLSHTNVWAWGLVALFLLVIATLVLIVPKIEYRLDQQSRARLAAAGIDTTMLSFSWNYRNLSVHGELPPGIEIEQLATALNPSASAGSTWFASGVRKLRLDVVKPVFPVLSTPPVQRLGVRFSTDGAVASLDGMVQTHAQRERLVGASLQAGIETINDNLEVMIGNLPANGGDVKVEALAQMLEKSGPQRVAMGQASLTADNLAYRITARDREAAQLIEQAASLAMVDFEVIGEMEYLKHGAIEAKAVSEDNGILLSGTVLSEAQHSRLSFAAAVAVGMENVVDEIKVSGEEAKLAGADQRIEVMAKALSLFRQGSTVSMQLKGRDLTLDAQVVNDEDRGALVDALQSGDDKVLTIRDSIKVLNENENNRVDTLQQQLDAYTEEIRKTVVFSTGEIKLSRRARATLDKVAASVKDYPGLKVEVEGHTDNVGRARVNDDLSQQRANAVREYLIKQSVPADSLVAVGYGQRRPIESNDTVEGRRLNRRVHFSVLEGPENE